MEPILATLPGAAGVALGEATRVDMPAPSIPGMESSRTVLPGLLNQASLRI